MIWTWLLLLISSLRTSIIHIDDKKYVAFWSKTRSMTFICDLVVVLVILVAISLHEKWQMCPTIMMENLNYCFFFVIIVEAYIKLIIIRCNRFRPATIHCPVQWTEIRSIDNEMPLIHINNADEIVKLTSATYELTLLAPSMDRFVKHHLNCERPAGKIRNFKNRFLTFLFMHFIYDEDTKKIANIFRSLNLFNSIKYYLKFQNADFIFTTIL